MRSEQFRGHLDMLLLGIVELAPAHGYAIISSLRDQTDGLLDLKEGAVYPALHRLEDSGLVASEWDVVEGKRRRVYRLTPQGKKALVQQHDGWMQLSKAVDAVLRPSPTLKARFA